VPEVRHSCPRETDIASRLLRKPKKFVYAADIIRGKKVNIVQEDRKTRFIVYKKRFSLEVYACPVIRMRGSSYKVLRTCGRLKVLAVTDQSRGDEQVKIRSNSDNFCYHSSFVCRKFMEIKIYIAVILSSVVYGCRTWSLNARRKWQEAGQNCVTYFII